MALKHLVARLKNRGVDTPDTPEKNMGYQKKVSIYAGCTPDTPDTPRFVDTPKETRIELTGEAANDLSLEPPTHTGDWQSLADAYHAHHFGCPACIAAGKGYGLRCGAGAALWAAYDQAEPSQAKVLARAAH